MLVITRPRPWWPLTWLIVLATTTTGAYVVHDELETSQRQAYLFADEARHHFFWLRNGPEKNRIDAPDGPLDKQRGYTDIPRWIERLQQRGYAKTWQAGVSDRAAAAVDAGLYPIYDTPSQAGLTVLSDDGMVLHEHRTPTAVFDTFEELPDLLVETLLFIENRELLEPGYDYRNPAVEWRRFAYATTALAGRKAGTTDEHFGGSTLATQLEKFRHSPRGITDDEREKVRQMLTAALRAYRWGPDTSDHQRQIVLDYVNSVPLSASPGYGEVQGIPDGLRVWFGAHPQDVVHSLERLQGPILHSNASTSSTTNLSDVHLSDARAFRKILSLFLAHRRPSHYLIENPDNLYELTDAYARILAAEQVISPHLRDAVLAAEAPVLPRAPAHARPDFTQQKALDAVRNSLVEALDITDFYALDRLDLHVQSTIDGAAQRDVDKAMRNFTNPEFLQEHGLFGHRLLERHADLDELTVSFTLFERTDQGNALRILADNHDQPLNINEHVKLDLGSTAKLRTLITYLELIAGLHTELKDESTQELSQLARNAPDGLRRWTAQRLAANPDLSLEQILSDAMDKPYSANPNTTFFTGGGQHRFSNFEHRRNHTQSVREAFRHSVNLVFVRMMRDIVDHYIWLDPERRELVLGPTDTEEREYLLSRFADREGIEFQGGFFTRYARLDPEIIPDTVVASRSLGPRSLAMVAMSFPDQTPEGLHDFVAQHASAPPSEAQLERWWNDYQTDVLDWQDRGYLTRIHPLELWTAAWLYENPESTWSETIVASREVRQQVYRWLFRTNYRNRQDIRIQTLLEAEAFEQIHHAWRRLGYPFNDLVPSLGTSIGSSADRPIALAELVGIIANGGVRMPNVRIDALIAGAQTPYEVRLERLPEEGERVMPEEVANTIHHALVDVVEYGTARRIKGKLEDSTGAPIVVGGKTGTGDHDHKVFDGQRLISSRPVHRTATFVFVLDDHFFGTLTVFVSGEPAGDFRFTSALPTRFLETLYPSFQHLVDQRRNAENADAVVMATDPGAPLAVAAAGGTTAQIEQAAQRLQSPSPETQSGDIPRLLDWEMVIEPDPSPALSSPDGNPPRLDWDELVKPEAPRRGPSSHESDLSA